MRPMYEKRSSDYTFRSDKNGNVPLSCRPHMHYHLELVYMIHGKMRAFVDSDEYIIEDGDIFLVFPNHVHHFSSAAEENAFLDTCEHEKYMLFIVNPDIMPELTRQFIGCLPECPIVHPENSDLYDTLCLLAHCHSRNNWLKESQLQLVRRGYLLSVFTTILGMMKFPEVKVGGSPAMQMIVDYCSANFSRELSLSLLEKELHISKYYISHLFSSRLSMRFNDYVNSLRISEACRYLRGSDKSITEIGETVGFGTPRTFNRAFAKQMGMTPGQYRRMSNSSVTVSMPN